MGAGYKTAIPKYVDNKMLQLPYQLMGQVLQTKDKAVDDTYATIDAFNELLKLDSLENDKGRAKEVVHGYESRADELARKLAKDPMSYKKHMREINNLGRELDKDMTSGEWGAISTRYNDDVEFVKHVMDLDSKEYSDEYKAASIRAARKKAGTIKFDKNTGKYNQYQRESMYGISDLRGTIEKYVKGKKADVESVGYDKQTDQYTIKMFDGSTEVISDEDLHNIIVSGLKSDDNTFKGLKHRQELDVTGYEDIFDDEGNPLLIKKGYQETVRTASGGYTKRNLFEYHDNKLGNAIQSVIDKYRKYDTSIDTGIKGAPGAEARMAADLVDKPLGVVIQTPQRFDNGIGSAEDVIKITNAVPQATSALVNTVSEVAKEFFGVEKLMPSQIELIKQGDYEELFTDGDRQVPAQIKEWKAQYKNFASQAAVADAYMNSFAQQANAALSKEEGKEYININGIEYDQADFDKYVADRQYTNPDVQSSMMYMRPSEMKQIRKEVKATVETGLAHFRINNDTNVTDLGELIAQGKVIVANEANKSSNAEYHAISDQLQDIQKAIDENAQNGNEEKVKALKRERADLSMNLSTMDDVELTYHPGVENLNFSVDENSINFENDYNNQGKLQYIAGVNIAGKKMKVNLTNVTSTAVQEYEKKHGRVLRANTFLNTHDIGEVKVPTGDVDDSGNPILSPNLLLDTKTGRIRSIDYLKNGSQQTTFYELNDGSKMSQLVMERMF